MKIAFIGQKGIPALHGGVEKHVEKLATTLATRGHEVTVYVRSSYTPAFMTAFEGVTLVHIPCIQTKHLEALSYSLGATLHALFTPFDVIHFQSLGPSIFSWIPRVFKPKTRVIATFHSREYRQAKWGRVARMFLRIAEQIICTVPERTIVSDEALVPYIRETYGREGIFIPSGPEVVAKSTVDSLAQLGVRSKRFVLAVQTGATQEGMHYLIKAFTDLEDTNRLPNNFKLVIVGISRVMSEYSRFLHHLAEGRSNILFREEEMMETLYSQAYMYVEPKEQEGYSRALMEAMGQGLMPLVSETLTHREMVANTGVYFSQRDIEKLKNEMAYYINRSDEVIALGNAAEERIREYYSWDAVAQKTLEVYQEVAFQNHKEHYASLRSK